MPLSFMIYRDNVIAQARKTGGFICGRSGAVAPTLMTMMMKLSILTCAEKTEAYSLVYRTKNHELKLISTGPISRGSQSGMFMVRDLWRKGFNKKVTFEFTVKEGRGEGWRKWRREGLVEISIKRINWFTKWKWKFIPEKRRGILKTAVCDLQRRGSRRTSKCDNIRGTQTRRLLNYWYMIPNDTYKKMIWLHTYT